LNRFLRLLLPLAFLPSVLQAASYSMPVDRIREPTPERFTVCFNHSCTTVVTDALSQDEWKMATEALREPAASAADERQAIARSIAVFESIVGRHTGTYQDKGGNLRGFGQPGQLDCIDESTNTTTYLRLLERGGLLHHHRVLEVSTRFGLFVGMPHSTAVIEETVSGDRYAVDSWFLDNGQPPYIARLEVWKSGGGPGNE
jgi:hypothetical protein